MEFKGQHILIVDDVLNNLQITAKILKESGYTFSLAQDGKSALALLENEMPDLILLDIMMPGIDGFEVCRRIKEIDKLKDIPIIFLTAKNQTEDLVEGFKAGGVDYITKPFNRDELLIRVNTHLELSRSRKKIVEMNKTRDKLYSIIAHDIRSPLSGISFTISAISSGVFSPCSADFMDIVKDLDKSTKETTTLLNNLLQWTKLQSSEISIQPKLINMYGVVLECVELLKANAQNKKITLGLHLPETMEAYADEVTVHTVFRNLITNAIKFTPEGGTITIKASSEGNFAAVTVGDTGVGISDEVIQKIFFNNEQYTSNGTNNEQGSGLGLYMVKDFVEKNHGKISVTSTLGVGTEITIYLPVSKSM
jgi:two-component system, sensor histidine kinase and response regulator